MWRQVVNFFMLCVHIQSVYLFSSFLTNIYIFMCIYANIANIYQFMFPLIGLCLVSYLSLSLSLFSHTLFLSSLNLKLYLWQFHDIQSQIIMGNRLPFPPTPSSLSPHPPLPHLTDNNRVFGINLLIQRHSLRRNKSTVKTGTFLSLFFFTSWFKKVNCIITKYACYKEVLVSD